MGDNAQRELVERAYRAYGHSVLRRARRILGDEQEARDVLQEVFVALLDRPIRFEGRSELGTYLYAATTHMCLNRLRDLRNRERLRAQRTSVLAPAVAPIAPDLVAALRQLVAVLSPDEAQVVIFHYVDGMSHAEIGSILHCSRRRVGDLLERLRTRLVRVLHRDVERAS